MIKFEKISYAEFEKDNVPCEYSDIKIPERKTKHSAGYDFYAPYDFSISAGQEIVIKTGIKALMDDDIVLLMFIRSSMGIKYNLTIKNQTGVIDSDYYGNPYNEGHIYIALKNNGEDLSFPKGTRIAQGVFVKYYTENDENIPLNERVGGWGSTKL
jgi:dUTP pyrophosphatase